MHQHEIDENKVKLTLDGEVVEITQGDLRKAMTARVKALEERRQQLEQNHGSADELAQIVGLIKGYAATASSAEPPDQSGLTAMKPAFADLLVAPNGDFKILVVDQYGTCVSIVSGVGFAARP